MFRGTRWLLTISMLLSSCIEPYAPPGSNREVNFLVVDGFLDSSTGDIEVKLSRALPLNSDQNFPPESNAQVSLEGEAGDVMPVGETFTGTYSRTGISINTTERYRITVRTAGGQSYVSDYVSLLQTPEIDSVTWAPKDDGIAIKVNTHDDTNATRYYQWRYEETWQYNAAYFSIYKFVNGQAIRRTPDELVYTCYRSQPSTQILVGTSQRLTDDVIRNYQIISIPIPSEKLNQEYSILVRQYALSREAYDFWSALEQTTENIGGLFDPQPGKVVGNVRNVSDPDEPVLGYFSGGTSKERRIFISYFDIPEDVRHKLPLPLCDRDSIDLIDLPAFPPGYLLIEGIYDGPALVGYTFSSSNCVDCRLAGGTTTKPDFWQ